MTAKAALTHLRERYRALYSMPRDCRAECAARNSRRMTIVLPLLAAFGLVMVAETFLDRVIGTPRFWVALCYYGAYALFSLMPLVAVLALRKRKNSQSAQDALCYATMTAIQLLCLSQRALSNYAEGYLVWTIVAIVVIALFTVNPLFFAASMALQYGAAIVYESLQGHLQFLNLGVLVLITSILAFTRWSGAIREHRNLTALRAATEKSDELLGNILPTKVIRDLKARGSCEPESFAAVSILFTDLVDFTEVSSSLSPEYLIGELSDLFSGFDCIAEKYDCTRIKTIGDAYMAACGLPSPDPGHAEKMVRAGLECIEYLKMRNEHSPIKWGMRVGVHSGPVVAGIVGARRYIYDVFGDTVNIASRMEELSREMRVNVSEATYLLTRELFDYEARESERVKGKGMMNMYFAQGLRAK
jgi:class 3 adenylate cyclase